MKYTASATLPARMTNSCLVLGLTTGGKLFTGSVKLEKATVTHCQNLLKQGDIDGTIGSSLMLHYVPGLAVQRVLLIGIGKSAACDRAEFQRLSTAAASAIHDSGTQHCATTLVELEVSGGDARWKARQHLLQLADAGYRFTEHKRSATPKPIALQKAHVVVADAAMLKLAKQGVADAAGVAQGVSYARDLGNLAPNICTPEYLADSATALKKLDSKLKVTVLDEARMRKLGMGALLSVSRGSRQPAKLICLEYRGAANTQKPVVLVGKGITFDTGGISIKPSASMDEMKYDMCGAASVLGAMRACLALKLKCNLVCVVAAAENMPDGDASRPGDVVTTMSGQTVEILNTDAEGRLVLCDALTWVERFKPAAVIDVATLTGACIIALGHVASAVIGNNDELTQQLVSAGETAADRTWPLPLWDDYQSQLDSNFADMANIGGRPAGTITAACFLSRFTKAYPWAHLDIAGVAWKSGKHKGATGRPVPLLMQFLLDNYT